MKHFLMMIIVAGTMFCSCEKDHKESNEVLCPIVDAAIVPGAVKTAFNVKYPNETALIWFNKDNIGYSAYFVSGAVKKLAQFANDGSFVMEDIETDHEDENEQQDSKTTPDKVTVTGCECEIEHD